MFKEISHTASSHIFDYIRSFGVSWLALIGSISDFIRIVLFNTRAPFLSCNSC